MTTEPSGSGGPERILALLWRHARPSPGDGSDRPARGRRPRLSLDAIIEAAVALADADGLAATSMSRVASSLGVGTMTLYTYVPSKPDLVDLMVDTALAERALPAPGESRPDRWRAQVELYAQRTRTMYHRHPWLRHVSTIRPPVGPGMLAEREYVLSTMRGLGLSPQQLDAAALAVTAFVNATTILEVESAEVERTTGQSNDAWWQDRTALWEKYFDVDRHPTMTQVWHAGGFDKSTAEATSVAYEFGLQRLLDGVQAVADQDAR